MATRKEHGGNGVDRAIVVEEKQHNEKCSSVDEANPTTVSATTSQPSLSVRRNNNEQERKESSVENAGTSKEATPESISTPPQEDQAKTRKRPICNRCHRPTPLACICEGLPDYPIHLNNSCHVLVLQHPHEERRKNRSLPLMQLCLAPEIMTVVKGRRFGDQTPEALSLLQQSAKVLLIFPAQPVVEKNGSPPKEVLSPKAPLSLSEALAFCKGENTNPGSKGEDEEEDDDDDDDNGTQTTLIVIIDATWKFAKEMDKINTELGLYPSHMRRVALSWDDPCRPPEAVVPCRFDIRTPPSEVHLSTAECLAWVLSALSEETENDCDHQQQGGGTLYAQLMKPLDVMVRKWHDCRVNKIDHHQHNHKRDLRRRREKRNKQQQKSHSKDQTKDGDHDEEETGQNGHNGDAREQPEQKSEPINYDYYTNPDHDAAVVSQLTEEGAVQKRASFFTSGDQERKLHNKKGRGRKRGRR